MVWERGSEILEVGHAGHVIGKRSGWLIPVIGGILFVIVVALLVLLFVTTSDFDSEPTRVPPTPGPCEPFCTATVPPPQPGAVIPG